MRPSPRRTWWRTATAAVAFIALIAAGGIELALRFGPTRPAEFRGKRVAHAGVPTERRYRVSYAYDDGGRRASDTDSVNLPFYLSTHWGSPLRVRTFGFGTFRFARLAGPAADRRDEVYAAVRWSAVVAVVGALVVIRVVRRRSVARADRVATG